MIRCIGRNLGEFHHRVARRLTRRQQCRGIDGRWRYTPLEEETEEAGLQELETYISRRKNTVEKFIEVRTIMDLGLEAERRPGSRVSRRWWEQEGLELEGVKERSAVESDVEEAQCKEGTSQE